MRTVLKKWGNSLALRIPLHIANELNIQEDSQLECSVIEGNLVIKPIARKPKYKLEELLAEINGSNIHNEISTGPPVGGEAW